MNNIHEMIMLTLHLKIYSPVFLFLLGYNIEIHFLSGLYLKHNNEMKEVFSCNNEIPLGQKKHIFPIHLFIV